MNYQVTIELLKLEGAECLKVNGKNMICIPVDAPFNYTGQKGVYTNLQMVECPNNKFGNSHLLKPNFSKDAFDKLTEEQKKQIAIIGNAKAFEKPQQHNEQVESAQTATAEKSDLPF